VIRMGEYRSLLFATWGLYDNWERVRYIPSFKTGSRPVEARSVLPLLLENIEPRPKKVYIFVADTVLKSIVNSYEEVVENIREYYLRFIDELGIDRSIVEIIVTPGVGEFKMANGWIKVFRGSLSDYYSYALYEICKILSEHSDRDLKVFLDLTHGINYMPTLIYRALKESLEIAALSRSIELTVYNSEPYTKGVEELRTHLVEAEKISPRIVPVGLRIDKCRLLNRYEGVSDEYAIELGKRLDETRLDENLINELNAFVGSLINGLPLALLTFYPDCNLLKERLDTALDIWRNEMEIKRDYQKLMVLRKASLNENFVKLLKIWLASKVLNLSRRYEASLRELHEIREKIFSKWEKLDTMISRDLKEVEDSARANFGMIVDCWKPLRDLGKGGEWSERNFLAHSGFERNVTEITVRSSEIIKGLREAIRLRYLQDKREKVLNASKLGVLT